MLFVRLVVFTLVALLAACRPSSNTPDKPKGAPAIGQAYAGPMTLPLRQELSSNSAVTTTVKHGDKLDVLMVRRRFVKVRSPQGIEGWTDVKQLLTSAQMDELHQLSADAIRLPSQGLAKATEVLNLHGKPSRAAPSFYQIPEGSMVQVVAHRISARNSVEPVVPLIVPAPKPARKGKKGKEKKGPAIPPPPMPKAPPPPDDWLALSNTSEEEIKAEKEEAARKLEASRHKEPVKLEDWYLVITTDKKAGWVLSRMVSMAIPDEVAQYAEGSRITSYFALGEADDDGVKHKHYLWTTKKGGAVEYDYDSFRVFIWSIRHHRYETAYVERKVVGYYPTNIAPVTVTLNKKPTEVRGFHMLVEGDNGKTERRSYWFEPSKVKLVDIQPAERPAQNAAGIPIPAEPATTTSTKTPSPEDTPSWTTRMKEKVHSLLPGKK